MQDSDGFRGWHCVRYFRGDRRQRRVRGRFGRGRRVRLDARTGYGAHFGLLHSFRAVATIATPAAITPPPVALSAIALC